MKPCSMLVTGETASKSQIYCLSYTSATLQTSTLCADKGRLLLTKMTWFSKVMGQSINEPGLKTRILVLLSLEYIPIMTIKYLNKDVLW